MLYYFISHRLTVIAIYSIPRLCVDIKSAQFTFLMNIFYLPFFPHTLHLNFWAFTFSLGFGFNTFGIWRVL